MCNQFPFHHCIPTRVFSHPVLNGFTVAAALLIAWSQFKPLLGVLVAGHSTARFHAACLHTVIKFKVGNAVLSCPTR